MILLQISGTPYPFLRSFVNNAGYRVFPACVPDSPTPELP